MSASSNDLILFSESKCKHPNADVLEQFDPLLNSSMSLPGTTNNLQQSSDRLENVGDSRGKLANFDSVLNTAGKRVGGLFDRDLFLEQVCKYAGEIDSTIDLTSTPRKSGPNNSTRSSTAPIPPRTQKNSLPINTYVELALLNFAKTVENCTPLLPPTKDKYRRQDSESAPLPEPPAPLNAYLFDGVVGNSTIQLSLDQTSCVDWRLNRSLLQLTEHLPLPPSPPIAHIDSQTEICLKIYVLSPRYFFERHKNPSPDYVREKLKTRCGPTKEVSVLMRECLEKVYGNAYKANEHCFRIFGRTDLLHPEARMGDHEYIFNCCRTGSTARLILEPFSHQETFLPTPEDRMLELNLNKMYGLEYQIPDRSRIENSLKKIADWSKTLQDKISCSPMSIKDAADTWYTLNQETTEYISSVCHGVAMHTLREAMLAVQTSSYDLLKKQTNPTPRMPAVTNAGNVSVEELQKIMKKKLGILEVQVMRNTLAFLKWKHAWHPRLQLLITPPPSMMRDPLEFERLVGCKVKASKESHRMTMFASPFVMRIGSIIEPPNQSPIKPGSFVRVHVALTYAGRRLSAISGTFKETSRNEMPQACATSVLHDYHYSRLANFNADGKIDEWIRFLTYSYRCLPRETLISISVIECKDRSEDPSVLSEGTLLGWVNVPLLDAEGHLRQEAVLAGLWPPVGPDELLPEARAVFSEPNRSPNALVVELEFPFYKSDYYFPIPPVTDEDCREAPRLPEEQRCELVEAASQLLYPLASGKGSPSPVRGVASAVAGAVSLAEPRFAPTVPAPRAHEGLLFRLWQDRAHLVNDPELLAAFLVAAPLSFPRNASHQLWVNRLSPLYGVLKRANPLPPPAALRLLMPDVADQLTRHWAVCSLSQLPADSLICYIPSLLEAVNSDLHLDWSGVISLLLHRSTISLRFCNTLYWHVNSSLMVRKWNNQHRLVLLKVALRWLRGSRLRATWNLQSDVLTRMEEIAGCFKSERKEELKVRKLHDKLDILQKFLDSNFNIKGANSESALDVLRMPYDFGICTRSLKVKECTYITSATCPIRVKVNGIDGAEHEFIFKVGDALQIDLLICQLIRVVDWIWLNNGMDLCIPHFCVMPTKPKHGFIQPVPQSETLRIINQESAAKGDQGLRLWLEKNQPLPEDFNKALHNFFHSTVAGSVLTFVLGFCDRHNDNILMRTNGQSFHIDFGKVFGNAQTFLLTFKRDRAPFVLTPDMLEVVKLAEPRMGGCGRVPGRRGGGGGGGGGDGVLPKELAAIPSFVDHCCDAFVIIRRFAFSIMSVLEMAWQMRLPGLERRQIEHVFNKLRCVGSDAQAESYFKDLILRSVQSNWASINNKIHDFSQRTKKQPITRDSGPQASTSAALTSPYTAQSVYLDLQPEGSVPFADINDFCPAQISVSDAVISRDGMFSKLVFEFEIVPESIWRDSYGGVGRSFRIHRDTQELKRLAWRLRDLRPNSLPAKDLLDRLSALEDQVPPAANRSLLGQPLLDEVKKCLVKLIQLHAQDLPMVNFWKPSEHDLERPRQSPFAARAGTEDLLHLGSPSEGFERPWQQSPPPPDGTAVLLTLQLSASADQLQVAVEQGHQWSFPGEELAQRVVLEVRVFPSPMSSTQHRRSCLISSPNPKLNEKFILELPRNGCKGTSLIFAARQMDSQCQLRSIGEAKIPVECIVTLISTSNVGSPSQSNSVTQWFELTRRCF